jgi:excisionase family DNA binding protein
MPRVTAPESAGRGSRLATAQDVAEYCGVPVKTVYTWNYTGKLNPIRVGRYVRYRWADIEAYLEQQAG